MRTTRRSAVTASGAAVLALAACSGDGPGPVGRQPTTTTSGTETDQATPDPDRVALERAFEITSALLADLAASDPVVDIGGEMAEIHAAHVLALESAAGSLVPSQAPVPGRELTAARLRKRELAAQRELATLAQGADSGALARLLASMSAGVAAGLSHRGEAPR